MRSRSQIAQELIAVEREEESMSTVLRRGGQLVGLLGILLMGVSAVFRLGGNFTLGGFETGTLFLAGIGAVSAGCFLMLWLVVETARR